MESLGTENDIYTPRILTVVQLPASTEGRVIEPSELAYVGAQPPLKSCAELGNCIPIGPVRVMTVRCEAD